ncbi:MAG: lipid IV(A) 3-deoxy-D-manno-octulosonic acid transferase [Betaproteobacteria bacterium]
MPRFAYTLLLFALVPAALFHLWRRGRRQPDYRRHVGERFGRYAFDVTQPVIWIHAVSVGETRAAEPLVKALAERHPDHRILLTHTTPTGRTTGEQLFGAEVARAYLPYDLPFAIDRFLERFRPSLGILMETELWFNLIHACALRDVPVVLVNARLSERSARGYRRLARLTREALRSLRAVGAQTNADAARLEALGAMAVTVTGNIKFDVVPAPAMTILGAELRELFGATRPVLLAASTREGEESIVLDAFARLGVRDALLVVVPRHPQRFEEVARLLDTLGLEWQRRSRDDPVDAATQVVLGDSMGEMFAYYGACDVAFIGGSLLPLGGQNLIEACAVGTPVLVGPHTFNFAESADLAIAAGAAIRVSDAAQLAIEARRILTDESLRASMHRAAMQFSAAHRGATAKTIELIETQWSRSP